MSLWNEYQGFSELAKEFGGPINFIRIIIAATAALTAPVVIAITVPITIHFYKQKLNKEKGENKLFSLKDYKCGEIGIKQGDIITIGSIDKDIALIKINNADDPYYVSYSELLKITKKMEEE